MSSYNSSLADCRLRQEGNCNGSGEKNSQEAHEKLMVNSREKRAQDAKSANAKSSAKAEQEECRSRGRQEATTGKELMATLEFISSPHAECDWSVQDYQVLKEERAVRQI